MLSDIAKNKDCLSVLVVTDEISICKTLISFGHLVTIVSNVREARLEMERQSFDLVLVDLRLRTGNKLDLILKSMGICQLMNIVVIIDYTSNVKGIKTMGRGAANYIAKPFTNFQEMFVTNFATIPQMEQPIKTVQGELNHLNPEISKAKYGNTTLEFSLEERLEYLREFGSHCMSFSSLQPGMKFFDMPGKGFISYRSLWGASIVLADPVCSENDRRTLIGEFMKTHPNNGFVQVTEPVADLIHKEFGYYATQFGIETVVDLKEWNLKGKKKQVIRTSVNKARDQGVTIRECYQENRHDQLTKEWMATRKIKNREIGFLIRTMSMNYEKETRKFFAYLGDDLIGFIFFDPIYKNGKIISYVPNISRFSHSFRQGIFYAIMIHAMEKFQNEGIEQLNLGLSILVLDKQNRAYEARLLKNIEHLIYRYGSFIYNFKGIDFTKSRFQGTENKFYCVHKWSLPVIKLISIFKLANVF
jgi:ActR/RegA family two-component response regulator